MTAATVRVLAVRELLRFFRQRSRVFGAIAQPLMFWLVLGSGIGQRAYFYPGVLLMVVLFTSIFATVSLIEDRHSGFLQAVLAAPAPRSAIVLGKTFGGAAIALLQAAFFLALAPLAGVAYGAVDWPSVAAILVLSAVALTATGFTFAWWLDNAQGFHAVMMVLLMPSWLLSGAVFSVEQAAPWLAAIMRANPLTHAVAALRHALAGGAASAGQVAILAVFAAVALGLATLVASRRT